MRQERSREGGVAAFFVLVIFILISVLVFPVIKRAAISKYQSRYGGDLLRVIEAIDVGKSYALFNFPNPVEFEFKIFDDLTVYSGSFEKALTNTVRKEGIPFIPAFSSEKFSGIVLTVDVTAQRSERTGFAVRSRTYYYVAIEAK